MSAEYVIGIDLGTTNCVLAYAPLAAESCEPQVLPIPQLVAHDTVEEHTSLPSFLYFPTEAELDAGQFSLPWAAGRPYVVGEAARRRSADAPERTVGAAKSWLCHSRVDRHQDILPWQSPADTPKISPVVATQRYLEHLIEAWNHRFPEQPPGEQVVVVTVPASFDASARELTRQAAVAAGLPEDLVLLEEPQAAVYSWLNRMGDGWRKSMIVGQTLLVCDVGGGTTDLTLIGIADEQGDLALRRLAVGDHLLVGGDNMDLALAHNAATLFADKNVELDPWQSVSLWHSCRAAKETLLAEDGPKKQKISVLGRGRKLVGGTVSVEVEKEPVQSLLLDGFLPECSVESRPERRRASGFQQIGLPYESETGITRHLAGFLNRHAVDGNPILPEHLLINGGVFKSEALRTRLLQVMRSWTGDRETPDLLVGGIDLDHAVARGAAVYGWTKQQGGIRIRGGTARSYYVGVETAGLAVPGAPRPLNALCVVPFGMEEGTEVDVPSAEIGLVVGEPAQFRFFGSSIRKEDRPGDVLTRWSADEIEETDSLEATLPADEDADDGYVPVRFHSQITELGVLELWCVCPKDDRRWKLEFSVRADADASLGEEG